MTYLAAASVPSSATWVTAMAAEPLAGRDSREAGGREADVHARLVGSPAAYLHIFVVELKSFTL